MPRPRKNVPVQNSNPPLNTTPTGTASETPNIPGVKPPVLPPTTPEVKHTPSDVVPEDSHSYCQSVVDSATLDMKCASNDLERVKIDKERAEIDLERARNNGHRAINDYERAKLQIRKVLPTVKQHSPDVYEVLKMFDEESLFTPEVKRDIPGTDEDTDEETYEEYERNLSSDVDEKIVRNFVIAEEMRKAMAESLSNYNIEVYNSIPFPKAWKVLTFNIPSMRNTFPEEEHLIPSAMKLEVDSVKSMLDYLEALFLRSDNTNGDKDVEIYIVGLL